MKTGIPCAYILTRKTCFSQRENLLSLKRNPIYIAVKPFIKTAPCSTLQCMISYLEMGILIQRGFHPIISSLILILPERDSNGSVW